MHGTSFYSTGGHTPTSAGLALLGPRHTPAPPPQPEWTAVVYVTEKKNRALETPVFLPPSQTKSPHALDISPEHSALIDIPHTQGGGCWGGGG